MWLKSSSLGEVLRRAFDKHNAPYVKRCIGYRGFWYVYL